MTASTSLAPRWPADATLLREVLRVARAKHWSRVFGDGSSEHLPDGVTVVAEWDQDGSLITLERWPQGDYVLDICGVAHIDAVSLDVAVDVLVAYGVLPVELSSAYRRGRVDGMEVIHELAVEKAADERIEELWSQLKDPDTLAEIGRDLDGLLDRDGFVRRAQVDLVVETVLKAAGMGS